MGEVALAERTIAGVYEPAHSVLLSIDLSDTPREIPFGRLSAAVALAIVGTSISGATPFMWRTGLTAMQRANVLAVSEMLRRIRKRTSLTWAELADIIGVSRRSVHHWANGATVSAQNEFKVGQLYDKAEGLSSAPAFVARQMILQEYGLKPVPVEQDIRAEPVLVADNRPVASTIEIRRKPRTRVR